MGTIGRYVPIVVRVTLILIAVIVAIVALHIVFVFLAANPDNPLASLVATLAGWFGWPFIDLFLLDDLKYRALVNYGIAIGVYAGIGLVVRSALRSPA